MFLLDMTPSEPTSSKTAPTPESLASTGKQKGSSNRGAANTGALANKALAASKNCYKTPYNTLKPPKRCSSLQFIGTVKWQIASIFASSVQTCPQPTFPKYVKWPCQTRI